MYGVVLVRRAGGSRATPEGQKINEMFMQLPYAWFG